MVKVKKDIEKQNGGDFKSKSQVAEEIRGALNKVSKDTVNGLNRVFNVPDGEEVELILVPRKKVHQLLKQKGEFVRIFQDSTKELISKGKLSEGACKLFLFLIAHLEFGNWIPMKKTEMSEGLGWGRNGRKIAKFMKELIDNGVIEKERRKYHSVYSYRLKINFAYKMKMADWVHETKGVEKEYESPISSKLKRNQPNLDDF